MKAKIDWKKWLITLIPVWVIIIVCEMILIGAYIGPLPKLWKLAAACVLPLVLVSALFLIEPVCRWIGVFEDFCYRGVTKFFNKDVKWLRVLLCILAGLAGGLVVERVLALAGGEGLNSTISGIKFIWTAGICMLISFGAFFWKTLVNKVHLAVFFTILIVGTVFATVLPVSCGVCWDDETHFSRSFALANEFTGRKSAADQLILDYFAGTALEHYFYDQESHEEWIAKIDAAEESGEWMPNGIIKPLPDKICYVPAAFGIALGRAVNLPYHMIFILGRWMNLLTYAILIAFAVYKLKSGKMLLFAISMLPPMLLIASSYSRDGWMLAMVALAFSATMGEIQSPDTKISNSTLALIVVAMFLGVATKAIYAPLMLIGLFIPKNKFKSAKQRKWFIIFTVIGIVILLATFMIPFLGTSGAYSDTRGGSDIDSNRQVAYVLEDPFRYAGILFKFLGEYFALDHAAQFFNFNAYLGNGPGAVVLMILVAVLTFLDADWEVDKHIKWAPRIATTVIGFICVVLAASSMYVAFTPVGSDTILGCQYRYLFTTMFLSLFVLRVPFKNNIPKGIYHAVTMAIPCGIALASVWTLFIMNY